MRIKKIHVLFLILLCSFQIYSAKSRNTLWYNKPAEHFEESLPLGKGKTSATVIGGVLSDKIYLNDATLWAGEPVNPDINNKAYENIPEIRKALSEENYKLADQLNKKIQGRFSESFAPLGTMFIEFIYEGKLKIITMSLILAMWLQE